MADNASILVTGAAGQLGAVGRTVTSLLLDIQNTTPSPQQRQHWLSEQALAWSSLPVVTIRPTVFLQGFFLPLTGPSVRDRGRIELNRAGRYDRLADGVERVTGPPAMSVREFVSLHADEFGGRRSSTSDTPKNTPRSGLSARN